MTAGLVILALVAAAAPVCALAALMVLLSGVPGHQADTASGVFNTSRQLGGALAVAVFGALLAKPAGFLPGLRGSLLIAAGVALGAGAASRLLRPAPTTRPAQLKQGQR